MWNNLSFLPLTCETFRLDTSVHIDSIYLHYYLVLVYHLPVERIRKSINILNFDGRGFDFGILDFGPHL